MAGYKRMKVISVVWGLILVLLVIGLTVIGFVYKHESELLSKSVLHSLISIHTFEQIRFLQLRSPPNQKQPMGVPDLLAAFPSLKQMERSLKLLKHINILRIVSLTTGE